MDGEHGLAGDKLPVLLLRRVRLGPIYLHQPDFERCRNEWLTVVHGEDHEVQENF